MMNKFKLLDDIEVKGKRVFIRLDLNVPLQDGKVVGFERLRRSAQTVNELVDKGAKLIIASHLGRPSGSGFEKDFSMQPVAEAFSKVIGKPIKLLHDVIGEEIEQAINNLADSQIVMLENIRFYKEETQNDPSFVKKLAKLADVYVSDAFSTAHRAHASTEGLAHELPAVAGRLMESELSALTKALDHPEKPMTAIVGGAKISTKLAVLHNLVKKADNLIIGGGMANTFLYSQGFDIKDSLSEKDMKQECIDILAEAKKYNCNIWLPVDFTSAPDMKAINAVVMNDHGLLQDGYEIFDAGPKSVALWQEVLNKSKTVVWNGPVGVFEVKPFHKSTYELAYHIAKLTQNKQLISVAGGGDTVSAVQDAGVYDQLTYISTAGGAFLEWMEGKELPGIKCLLKN